jgi:hypothetical protein
MDLVFTIIILLFVIVYFFTCDTTEGFADTATKIGDMSRNELEATIYQIYKADVLAIKNLADTATKLQVGGLTIPGNLDISGNQKVDGTMHIKGATTIGGKVAITGDITAPTIKDLQDRINLLEKKTATMTIDGTSVIFSNAVTANALNSTSGRLGLSQGWIFRKPGENQAIELHANWNGYAFVDGEGNMHRRCEPHRAGWEYRNCY